MSITADPMTDLAALIGHFAEAATEPHALPTPAPSAELAAALRPLRREAQARFDVDGLPRGFRKVA